MRTIPQLADLPGRFECDCGGRACYKLSVTQGKIIIKTELRLCGKCLALEMQARRKTPLSSDID